MKLWGKHLVIDTLRQGKRPDQLCKHLRFLWATRVNRKCNSPKEMTFYFWAIEECCMSHKWQESCVCSGWYLVGGLGFGMPWVHIQGEFGQKLHGQVSSFRLGPRQEQPRFLLFQVTEFMYPSSKTAQVGLKCCQSGLRFASLSLTRKSPLDESLGRKRGQDLCVIRASTILCAVSFAFQRHI